MDRGRGSADQRNQATISHELQKYSRSRIGKGMNSRDGRSLDTWVQFAGQRLCRRPGGAHRRRAGAELVAGEQGRRLVASGRRPASRTRHLPACSLEAARSARVRASGPGVGDRGRECTCVCWAGPYRMGRYVSADVLNIHEINKNLDTLPIRIHHVSDTYPYRICIRYGIRHLPGVSVLHRYY
jgi:hypothetical protein